ncbi:MAG: myo-inositol 2-dehydrogenase [Rhodobacteraceae bacterium]|uniref:inositol 2-dehydrogenase n=1 Tax=Cypionkella sp. TaxID=2811411 RepID=UPI001329D901|nr:inositol 2-dehydrogenase [Cypionkella sp.]KAF0175038.1 MAG: myo-inositol 2-dehydrogenase [Paracoccaceae bacterium]MDO8325471.1 inositol 2-dehydrogenase [Cypionkella sp.]
MQLRFAILGAGRIGQVHARAVAGTPGAKLVAIADPVAKAAESVQAAYGCDIRSIDAIVASADVDAVVICTPTDTHADLIERFTKAGKAVFCEKPVDLSLARVKACLTAVAANKGTVMVGFNRRFDPDFMGVKAAIDDGTIGTVEMVTITSRDPGAPPADYITRSGGIFRDMTIHDFDMARWLLGEEVETVQAAASVLTDKAIGELGDFDSVNVILRTATGKQAIITNTRRATYGYDQRIEVLGSKGMVYAENQGENRVVVADKSGFRSAPLLNFFMTRYIAAYANEIAAFVDAVNSGKDTPTTTHDGLMALALAEAALKSVAEGRTVKLAEVL